MRSVEQSGPNDPYGLRSVVDAWRETSDGKRLSYDDIAFRARDFGAPDGFVGSWLSKVFSGGRPYDIDLLAAIAKALGRQPDELPHYRLALARRLLDERANGLEGAMETLSLVEIALREQGLRHLATAAEQIRTGTTKQRAAQGAPPTPLEGRRPRTSPKPRARK